MTRGAGCHYLKAPVCPHKRGRSLPSYREWGTRLGALRPGEALVYHVDSEPRDPGVFAAVWDGAPDIVPVQRRRKEDDRLIYLAVRR